MEEKVTFTKETKSTGVEKCPTTLHENRSKGRPGKYTTAALQIRTQERIRCLLCQKFHDISTCTEFLASDVDERWRIAKRLGLCHSCLKKGHRKIECGASRKTATGETNVHDLLNRKDAGDKKIDEKTEENVTKVCLKIIVDKKNRSSSYSNGSLQIARAVICAGNGIKRTVSCILVSTAQRSFVKREVVESLGLNGPKEHITISGFNQRNEHHKLMRVELRLKGVDNGNFCVIDALCVSHLCGKVSPKPPMEEHKHLKGLKLVDQFPREEVEIHLLIRFDHYYDIVLNEIKRVDTSKLTAVKTIFGWVICGKNIPQNRTHLLHCKVDEECKCECDIIKNTGELRNELEVNDVLELFKNEVKFDGERYVVKLPWKSLELQISNNYEQAERRLQQLEERQSNSNERAKEYDEVIKNYMDRGWIEETDEKDGIPGKTWYLPHHAVYRDDKMTTRCRIVFDASAKYHGTSLNDFFEAGPPLQNQILDISIRFRRFKIGVQADISKMFLQIRPDPEDKDASRFLWRNMKEGKKPRIFRFSRVTFGLNCAPFLAMAVLHHHADLNQAEYGKVAENVKRNIRGRCNPSNRRIEKTVGDWRFRFNETDYDVSERACGDAVKGSDKIDCNQIQGRPSKERDTATLRASRSSCDCEINFTCQTICCWSDSQITLCWIRNVARTWKPFVKNRVESIHELVKPEDWRYRPTKDNPADVVTRGTTLRKLKDNHLWWNGPKWLHDENQWPKERLQRTMTKEIQNIIEEERKPTLITLNVNVTTPPILEFEKFGNFEKMLRLTAYCKRFASNCKTLPERRKLRELTSEEIITTEKYSLKTVQRDDFHDEIQILQNGRPLPNENRLNTLDPFLDEDGLLRVGGGLRLSNFDYEMKYPIILPKKHHVVNLIIDRAHSNTLHAGNSQTLTTLRQNFWILNGRAAVKRVLRNCVICKKTRDETV
ncbi:hypothetical protein T03_13469 [Trichinella britovi]|uniref:Integrase zinc-binding domain-containing protein n=1 Tax=Trichinella britovi TaxID=45882 RepID=A0A0V1CA85_TRIBR|nr:hypothetical protein T03_13469 [Trichinella britovi]